MAAIAAMAARIGPAQGDQTRPREKPVINPPKNPLLFENEPPKILLIRLTYPSKILASAGTIRINPKNPITKTAIKRKLSGSK